MQRETLQSNQQRLGSWEQFRKCYPFIKWAGGKTQSLPELQRYVPSRFDRYFEPFLGGGAFFFYLISIKRLKFNVYLSDLNEELINAYHVVKNDVEKLIECLTSNQQDYKKNPHQYYYKLRAEIKLPTRIEAAARFITLNKTCYNGLYRVNKSGLFNVPIGKYKKPLICNSANLKNVSLALRHFKARVTVSDYKKILDQAFQGDFVYLDPPYNPTSSSANFTGYTNGGFDDNDQVELCDLFTQLDRKGCKVLLSNSDTEFVRKLYVDFKDRTKTVSTLRAISCKGSKRSGHKELLIRNYD